MNKPITKDNPILRTISIGVICSAVPVAIDNRLLFNKSVNVIDCSTLIIFPLIVFKPSS